MRTKVLAGVVALIVATGAGWGIWYHSGAHCRDVLRATHSATATYNADYALHGWMWDTTQADWRYIQAFVSQNPSCFSATARAFMATHGN